LTAGRARSACANPTSSPPATFPNAINLPLSQMRSRYAELPRDRDIWICCGVGQRAYYATRFLAQHGYRSRNMSGGYPTYKALRAAGRVS
jgi:rhodanese-related sulfurtransferase